MNKKLNKCKNIKILLTDVDCVLTDGGMYYTSNGDFMKKFHTRDGMGVTLLSKNKVSTIVITKEKTKMARNWAKKMNIKRIYDGVQRKEMIIEKICKEYKVSLDEVSYIGDDVNDLELLKKVGFSAAPNDSIEQVKKIVDYVCEKNGGEGVFREVADLIIRTKFPTK